MRKIVILAVAAIIAAGTMQAVTTDALRIYLNPGHGSFGPNDRPMSTVGHPGTSNLADPDSLGFYEGRGTLQRAFGIARYLKQVGVKSENIVFSRLANGPWPYVAGAEDADMYNRPLSEICEEVELGNFDMFISDHSNAATDGTNTNYPLVLYRGYDLGTTGAAGYDGDAVEGSYEMACAVWDSHYMSELDPQSHYSLTSRNIRGDISFYGSYSTGTRSNGKKYSGYLGVLKHGVPGFLLEAFYHTYQPARHRALNFDYDQQEGRREARGIAKYFGLPSLTTGDIMGAVRDLHEKFAHTYYHPAPGTDDVYLPLNGAVVKLLKDGNEVATYTVDNEYNGIFVFEDLEPGDYTLDVALDGYKPLFDEYKVPITVTADKTSYAKLWLESEDYVAPVEVFENYPDPKQPNYLKLASEFIFSQSKQAIDFAGTVKDAVQLGDSTIVLTNDGKVPHLYLIKTSTKELVKELSTQGIYTEASPGFFSPLNAINRTADNKLVGVSFTENQYGAENVADGYTRGTARVYIWNSIDGDPTLFTSTTSSGNYYYANVGHAIAVNGPSTGECEILITAMTTGSSLDMRLVHINMVDGEQSSVFHDNLYSNGFVGKQDAYGEELHLAISPNGDDKAIIGGMGTINEFVTPTAIAGTSPNVKQLSDEFGATGVGFQCFKYAGHSLLVTPYAKEGVVKGIKILDITDGIENAKLIKTVNTDLVSVAGMPHKATHHDPVLNGLTQNIATAMVDGIDIEATLVGVNGISMFTTRGVDQPIVKGIYAYGLRSQKNGNKYTFTFTSNDNAVSGSIIFSDRETSQVLGEWPLTDVVEGENSVTLTVDQIPGVEGMTIDWAVKLVGNTIPNFGLIYASDNYAGQLFNTVDRSPESRFFGRIYVGNRVDSGDLGNGMWIYSPEYERINTDVINARTDGKAFGSNYRMGIDSEGKVYMPDWGDGTSGVFIFDPSAEEGIFYPFFANEDGSSLNRDGHGLLTNNAGEAVAGSSPGVYVAGKGDATKLFVYNEDLIIHGTGNNVSVYNIGNTSHWNQAPDITYAVGPWQLNTNGNVWGYPDGSCWVSQYRSEGKNSPDVPSLMFIDPEGNVTFNSGRAPFYEYLNGSDRAGFAVNEEDSVLSINDGSGIIQFFDVKMDGYTPTLTPKYSFKATQVLNGNSLFQMNYDYAGNLVVTGSKLGIYAVPTEDNQATTPARSEFAILKELSDVTVLSVSKHVKSVRYYNVAGASSDHPFTGVNIIVTTYDDGTQKTIKAVH